MAKETTSLVIFNILADDEKAAQELAAKAGISVADLSLLALRFCLRAKGAEPFREMMAEGGVKPPRPPEAGKDE